jgi:hypothetical protein
LSDSTDTKSKEGGDSKHIAADYSTLRKTHIDRPSYRLTEDLFGNALIGG